MVLHVLNKKHQSTEETKQIIMKEELKRQKCERERLQQSDSLKRQGGRRFIANICSKGNRKDPGDNNDNNIITSNKND